MRPDEIWIRTVVCSLLAGAAISGLTCGGSSSDTSASGGHGGSTTSSVSVATIAVGNASAGASMTFPDGGLPPAHCADPANGSRVLYVDGANGNDGADGMTEATAWKTLAHAIDGDSAPVAAGDTVMIKGGVYRERITLRKSGTSDKPIVIRAAGDSDVIVDGSNAVSGWSLASGAVYTAKPGFAVLAVVAGDTPLLPAASANALSEGTMFFDSGSGTLSVWLPGGVAPTTGGLGVIKVDPDKAETALNLNGANHVTVCGLSLRYAGAKGIIVHGDYDRVEQCRIEFNGDIGATIYAEDSVMSTNGAFVGNEIAWNFMQNWPRCSNGFKSGGWGTGVSAEGTPNTLFSGNLVHDNGGEGIVAGGTTEGVVIEGNVLYDNWSVNIYTLNIQNVTIADNLSFSHAPDLTHLTGNQDPDPSDGECAKRLRPVGIATGDEDNGSNVSFDSAVIANNLIVGCRDGYSHVNEVDGSGVKDVTFVFNTLVLPNDLGAGEEAYGIDLDWNNGNNKNDVFRDNVVYAAGGDSYLLSYSANPNGGDLFQGITIDHNLFFHATSKTPIHWGPTWDDLYDHAGWAALAGAHAGGDVAADPKLESATGYDAKSFCPSAGSPAIDVGMDVSVTSDYFGTKRPVGKGFDLGACEAQ